MGGDPRFAGTNHNDIELFVVTDSQNFVTHVAKDYAGMDRVMGMANSRATSRIFSPTLLSYRLQTYEYPP